MEFRWLALIALWTLVSGPIFYTANPARVPRAPAATQAAKPVQP
jgi:hypothetical protein